MGAREILDQLDAKGFWCVADRDLLLVRPVANLPPDLRRAIIEHKAELMDIAPRRYWTVHVPGRDPFGLCCVQGINRADLLARYPHGTTVEVLQ